MPPSSYGIPGKLAVNLILSEATLLNLPLDLGRSQQRREHQMIPLLSHPPPFHILACLVDPDAYFAALPFRTTPSAGSRDLYSSDSKSRESPFSALTLLVSLAPFFYLRVFFW
ncbi:hypothetical protein M404DRAFT_992881, partial [Pisolithus tinctorius Marx 270]